MLLWRIIVAAILITALLGACWLDNHASIPGLVFILLGFLLLAYASSELIQLMEAGGMKPLPAVVYGGNVLVLAGTWFPIFWKHWCNSRSISPLEVATPNPMSLSPWSLACLVLCLVAAFIGAMRRFKGPGGAATVLAATMFAVTYLGLTFSFLAQVRLLWGMKALISLIFVVKLADSGAYFVGKLIGRHKCSPVVSPGKTWEGTIAAIVFAALGGWLSFIWMVPGGDAASPCACWRWILYGIFLGVAGIFGDLAESLLKRDAGVKNSSAWMPGLGGVLDVLDSLLLAAPVAWICWIVGLIQRYH
jgi:phosphatidate cytidylyltransferase